MADSEKRSIRRYLIEDKEKLIAAINIVCAEGRWLHTPRYLPTPAWEHSLAEPECECHLLMVVVDGPKIVGWCRIFPEDDGRGGWRITRQEDHAHGRLPEGSLNSQAGFMHASLSGGLHPKLPGSASATPSRTEPRRETQVLPL